MAAERRDVGAGGYLSRYEFEEAMKRVDGRLNQQDSELTKIRERLHAIGNHVSKIQAIEMIVDKISEALDKVPRKSDVDNVSKKLDEFLAERKSGIRWSVVIAVSIGMPVIMLALQIIAKKLGLL